MTTTATKPKARKRKKAAGAAPGKSKPHTLYPCWELVEQVVGRCDRVLLWGVSGTGKSWAARRANLNGAQVYSVSLTDDTPAAELRGHYGLVDGSYRWLDGPCVMAWRSGARLVLNELEKASGDAQTFLLGMLDDIEIAQQTLPTGETITPTRGFHVCATMNGHPDEDLNPALRDRFPVCVHIDQVAPPALRRLPPDLQGVAQNSGIIPHAQRRVSVRVWNEFARLRGPLGDEMAAAAVFGDRARTVLDHLKLASA
jgi:MoxR-like ATPase